MDKEKKQFIQEISKGRTFGSLPILDGYIFREFMIPFSILTFTFILLFLIGDVFADLNKFLEYKGSNASLLAAQYFLLKIPGNIRFVLPISVLLSCMYTIANLGRCREITAMRASGISMVRCGGAIYIAALCVTFVNFWFNEQIVPDCSMRSEILLEKVKNPNYQAAMYNMLQYRSPDKMRDWLFDSFTDKGPQGAVYLKQYKKDSSGKNYVLWDLQAARVENTRDGWYFYDGYQTGYHELIHIPGAPKPFKKFFISKKDIPENTDNIENAVKPPEELSSASIFRILKANPHMAPSVKSIYKTLLYYRLAFPWSCFLCVFLGLPLAVKNERSGIFLSIAAAVGAIVIFQMLTEIFLVLGKQGFVPPIIGGLAPTLSFLFYSYFFVIRKSS